MKEYIKFLGAIICGLGMITVAIIVIFHIFPAPSGSKGFDAALAIAGTVMFWAIAGGIALGIGSLINTLRKKIKHKS